jgi:hypothetical protein
MVQKYLNACCSLRSQLYVSKTPVHCPNSSSLLELCILSVFPSRNSVNSFQSLLDTGIKRKFRVGQLLVDGIDNTLEEGDELVSLSQTHYHHLQLASRFLIMCLAVETTYFRP